MEYISTPFGPFPKMGLGTFSIPQSQLPGILSQAVQMGCTLFDTALLYRNEDLIGQSLQSFQRQSLCLQTKVNSQVLRGCRKYLRLDRISVSKAYRNACSRLRTPYLNAFLFHQPFRGYERQLQKAFALKAQGIFQLIGICNITLPQLQSLHAATGLHPDIIQVEIHPYHSNQPLVRYCQQHGIIVQARSPFAHGDAFEAWSQEPVLQELAATHQATIPQLILRWSAQQDIVVLPRTSNIHHLAENLQSFNLHLSPTEIDAINSLNQDRSFGVKTNQYNIQ